MSYLWNEAWSYSELEKNNDESSNHQMLNMNELNVLDHTETIMVQRLFCETYNYKLDHILYKVLNTTPPSHTHKSRLHEKRQGYSALDVLTAVTLDPHIQAFLLD